MTQRVDSPIRGLVLAGGESQRMGVPKGSLVYLDKPQCQVMAELMSEFCAGVFISIRESQRNASWLGEWPILCDIDESCGPMSGLKAAFDRDPKSAWWVIGCDMPLVDRSVLKTLEAARDMEANATVYLGTDNMPEPLCSIYEPSVQTAVQEAWGARRYGLRDLLKNYSIQEITPTRADSLKSIDTPAEFSHYIQEIKEDLHG
jgi:molybdopterin-guanine dinucleotide biosynthesis protein A